MTLALVLGGTAGCGFTASGKRCASGPGVRAAAYRGASLGVGQWSLTFDGKPGDVMAAVGDELFASGVQGTFFVTGRAVPGHGTVLQNLKAQGHLVANGGYSGTPLAQTADPVTEVRKTDELILPYVSGNLFLLRAPGGQLTEADARRLDDAGLTRYVGQVGWDVAAVDCSGLTADACASGYADQAAAAGKGILQLGADAVGSPDVARLLLPRLEKLAGFGGFVRLDAVPELAGQLQQSGGAPGTVGGDAGCNEY